MKTFLIVIGILLTAVAGIIIFQDVYNFVQAKEHAVKTALSLGSNLLGDGEKADYLPPYTAHELLVMALALGGIFALIAGIAKSPENAK